MTIREARHGRRPAKELGSILRVYPALAGPGR